MDKKIKVLQILGGGEAIGGVDTMLLNYYLNINKNIVRFDFCFFRESTFSMIKNEEYKSILDSSKIIELKLFKKKSTFFGYSRAIPKLIKIIKKEKYDIVHINGGRPAILIAGAISAFLCGVKVRIAHSHSTASKRNKPFFRVTHFILSTIIKIFANNFFACSTEAGKYMFGKKIFNKGRCTLIKNAISVRDYSFNNEERNKIRTENGIGPSDIVVGHIGRFSIEKNQRFVIDVFHEFIKMRPKAHLWLIGNGNLKIEIEKDVKKNRINDNIAFLGERNDISKLLQGMDIFVFPSYWEGLSVTLIEAQAASLPILASDSISREHRITNLVDFLSLNLSEKVWAESMCIKLDSMTERGQRLNEISDAGYDISIEAAKLEMIYKNLVNYE